MSATAVLSPAPLETERFGVRTLRAGTVTVEEVPRLLGEVSSAQAELVIVRCHATDAATLQALQAGGFRVMDTIVYFERDLERRPLEPGAADPRVRLATAADTDEIVRVARVAFSDYYGHYHADPRLDRAAADEAYVHWTLRSCVEPGCADAVFVAEVEGRIGAFSTAIRDSEGRGDWLLAGVAPEAQRHGLYRAMAGTAMAWAAANGLRAFRSSTQLRNLGVQKVWVRIGMEPAAAYYTLHLWT